MRNEVMFVRLRRLKPGCRVHYDGWRGDSGGGVFMGYLDQHRKPISPSVWGAHRLDGLLIKRDFSADDGVVFMPFAGDGDVVMTDEMVVESVADD